MEDLLLLLLTIHETVLLLCVKEELLLLFIMKMRPYFAMYTTFGLTQGWMEKGERRVKGGRERREKDEGNEKEERERSLICGKKIRILNISLVLLTLRGSQ